MELNEEFKAKPRPKIELSVGPDGAVILTKIPTDLIAQEKFDTEFNLDWGDSHTSDDCEQNSYVTSTEMNSATFLAGVKDLQNYFIDSTKLITHESMPSTESYTQESDVANTNNIQSSFEVIAQENPMASEHYKGNYPKDYSRQSYSEKNTIPNVISNIFTESNTVKYAARGEHYSENLLTITSEDNSKDTKDISIANVADDGKRYLQESAQNYHSENPLKEFIQYHNNDYSSYQQESPDNYNEEIFLREFIEADAEYSGYLRRSPKSVNNDDILKEIIGANTQDYSSYQQVSPRNCNDDNLLKEFIELSNVKPFVATDKNYAHTFTANSGNKYQTSTETTAESNQIVSKTCNSKKSNMEFSAKIYSMEYASNSETNTQNNTKMAYIAPLSQNSIEASTDTFGIESFPDISDYEIESPLKADDELLEEFMESSAKAIFEPFVEDEIEVISNPMEVRSMEPFATLGKMFLEVPPSPANQSCSQKTFSKELLTSTGKLLLEVPSAPNTEMDSQNNSIAKSGNNSVKSLKTCYKEPSTFELPTSPGTQSCSKKMLSKELIASTGKMLHEECSEAEPNTETDSQNNYIAKNSQSSVKASKKNFGMEHISMTGKKFLELPPSPSIKNIANIENNRVKSLKRCYKEPSTYLKFDTDSQKVYSKALITTGKMSLGDTFVINSGNDHEKYDKISKNTLCGQEQLATPSKKNIELPPSSSMENDSQDGFIPNNIKKSRKSVKNSIKTLSKEHFATTGKKFLEIPPSPGIGSESESIETGGNNSFKSVTVFKEPLAATCKIVCGKSFIPNAGIHRQDTFIAQRGNTSQKSIESNTKTLSKELFEITGKKFLEIPPSPSIESKSIENNGNNSLLNEPLIAATFKMVCGKSLVPNAGIHSQDTFVAQSGNTSQKSIESNTSCKELFETTGKRFFKVSPSPNFNTYSQNTFTATTYSQKTSKTDPKTYTEELFTTTGKMFVEVPPSPSVDSYSQDNFTAKSGKHKASVETHSNDPFIGSYKMFLEKLPPTRRQSNVKLENYIQIKSIAKNEKFRQKYIKPLTARCKTSSKEPPIVSVETRCQVKSENYSKQAPMEESYDNDCVIISDDSSQLSPVARTEDCSLGSPISINESFCSDSPQPIIEETQLEWPNLSIDDISANCGDNLNSAILDLEKCAKCFADLTGSQEDLHLCDPDKVLNVSYEETNDNSQDKDNEDPCTPAELTREEKKKSKIDHRTLSGKYKKKYRIRPRPDFKKPLPKPCNKDCKTCHICNKEFGRKRLLLVHLRRHTDSLHLKCEFCDKKFAASYDLERHARLVHVARNRYCCFCSLCRMPFYSRTAAFDHQKRAHSHTTDYGIVDKNGVKLTPVDEEDIKYDIICDVCGLKFCQQYDLDAHNIKSHTTVSDEVAWVKPYMDNGKFNIQCDVCGLKFNKTSDLDIHTNKSHSVKRLSCDACGLKFNEKSDLDAHVKSHEKQTIMQLVDRSKFNLKCDVCELKFNKISDLDNHIKKSHSVTILSCDACGLKFNEKSDLDAHVKSHEKQTIIQFYTPHKIEANTNVVLII